MKEAIRIHYKPWLVVLLVVVALLLTGTQKVAFSSVSGQVISGFRVLTLENTGAPVHLVVYRGDYIKFVVHKEKEQSVVRIPDLGIETPADDDPEVAPYFKMKKTGRFDIFFGGEKGLIEVVEYQQANYRELTPTEAFELIQRQQPLVLDVRTKREYQQGHLNQALLIPVQELQHRIKELDVYKKGEILLYCATGNRSTVASKILIDSGFSRILNLRRGIVGWQQKGLPVVK